MGTLPRHRSLPRLVEQGEAEDASYILIEDVGGEDIDTRWRRRPPALDDILDMAECVSAALGHLHAHGVLHLDVTEANIVATEGGFVLVDLGVGAPLGQRKAVTVDGAGTDGRRAPEASHPARKVDGTADVYVLSMVVAEALLGGTARAWPAVERDQLAACGLNGASIAHRRLLRLISTSLALDRARRPSAVQFNREIRDLRRDQGRWPRRPILRGIGASAAAIALVGTALVAYGVVRAPAVVIEQGELPPGPGGYLGVPFFLDRDTVATQRHQPMWAARAPPAQALSELLLHVAPKPTWTTLSQWPGNALGGQVADIDGDGYRDLVVYEHPPTGPERHRILWGPDEQEDEARYESDGVGRPFLLPDRSGHPRLLVGNEGTSVTSYAYKEGRYVPDGEVSLGSALAWLDVDDDGAWDVLGSHGGGLDLAWHGSVDRISTSVPMAAWWQGPGETLAVADMDGDGDEDVIFIDVASGTVKVLLDAGDRLVEADVVGLGLPSISAASQLGYGPLQAVDLDADGLRDLLLPSGGFPPQAHPPCAWHNEGSLHFQAIHVPWAEAHDGSRLLTADLDHDGRIDLLDLSINDALQDVPDHRVWKVRPRRDVRFRTYSENLPFGTALRSTGRPWIHVVRDAGPILVPPDVGPLLVRFPDGTEAPEGGTGTLPALHADDVPGLVWRALVGGKELRLLHGTANDELHYSGATVSAARLTPTWSCSDERNCLFLEAEETGGWRALALDPESMALRVLDVPGEMIDSAAADGAMAFSSRAGTIQRRDALTFAALGAAMPVPGGRRCDGIGVGGDELACCSLDPPSLTILDVMNLAERSSVNLPTGGSLLRRPSPRRVGRVHRGWCRVGRASGARQSAPGGAGLRVIGGRRPPARDRRSSGLGERRPVPARRCILSGHRQPPPGLGSMAAVSIIAPGQPAVVRPLAAATVIGRGSWCTWIVDAPGIPASWLEFRWEGRSWQMCVLRDIDRTELRGVRPASSAWLEVRVGSEARGPDATVAVIDDGAPQPFVVGLDSADVVTGESLDRLLWWEGDQARNVDSGAERDVVRDGETFVAFGQRYRLHAGAPIPRTRRTALDLMNSTIRVSFSVTGGKYGMTIHQGGLAETVRDRSVLIAIAYALARTDREVSGGYISADEAAERMVLYEGGDEGAYGSRYVRELRSRLARRLSDAGVANPSALFEVDPAGGRMWRLRTSDINLSQ